jgi:hypothetical protein
LPEVADCLESLYAAEGPVAGREAHTVMSFTIIRNLEVLPSYPMLCRLAAQNDVRVTGNEHAGSFAGRDVEGDYEFGENGLHGKFAAHGVTGELSFETGKATITVIKKPFWLPEMLLKRKITEGLNMLCNELAQQRLRASMTSDENIGDDNS